MDALAVKAGMGCGGMLWWLIAALPHKKTKGRLLLRAAEAESAFADNQAKSGYARRKAWRITVVSDENVTITCFSRIVLHRNLGSWSPWVPLHGICAPWVPVERI